jgi:predicted NBD/HSP70 family sugar kinase
MGVYASIDLGGTKIAGALATEDGQVLAQQVIATESHAGPTAVLSRIAGLLECLAAEAGVRPQALGMGVPGLADLEHGVVKFLPNLPTQWREVTAGDYLARAIGCRVRLLNDVRMATLGELVQAAEYLGIAVANTILMVHPNVVVLGGSVAEIGPLLFDTVRATVAWRVGMFSAMDIAIVPSRLGNRAGLWGGIALAAGVGI